MKKLVSLLLNLFIVSSISLLSVSALVDTTSTENISVSQTTDTSSTSDETSSTEITESNSEDDETTATETLTSETSKDTTTIPDTTVFDNFSDTEQSNSPGNDFILYLLIGVLALIFIALFLYLILN